MEKFVDEVVLRTNEAVIYMIQECEKKCILQLMSDEDMPFENKMLSSQAIASFSDCLKNIIKDWNKNKEAERFEENMNG